MTILEDLEEENPLDELYLKPMMVFIKDEFIYKVFTIKNMLQCQND